MSSSINIGDLVTIINPPARPVYVYGHDTLQDYYWLHRATLLVQGQAGIVLDFFDTKEVCKVFFCEATGNSGFSNGEKITAPHGVFYVSLSYLEPFLPQK